MNSLVGPIKYKQTRKFYVFAYHVQGVGVHN